MKSLIAERPDIKGLPFLMGDACRSTKARSLLFNWAVRQIRAALPNQEPKAAARFWVTLQSLYDEDVNEPDEARIAALMQILGPEPAPFRLGLVKYLADVRDPEAARALARLAIYSAEDEVRRAAIDALLTRKERNYNDLLQAGLRYPWPEVACHAADAIARLKRDDLVPQLVALLDEPDPRSPQVQKMDSKQVTVVRELVRINHLRNCVMCHPPGINLSDASVGTGQVPSPIEDLETTTGYNRRFQSLSPDRLVRTDVTYLRQDFSLMQSAPTRSSPWPEMQRFDFLVRTRQVDAKEAAAYKALYASDPGSPSPYRQAALTALCEMTCADAGPNTEAWRKRQEQPATAPVQNKVPGTTDAPVAPLPGRVPSGPQRDEKR